MPHIIFSIIIEAKLLSCLRVEKNRYKSTWRFFMIFLSVIMARNILKPMSNSTMASSAKGIFINYLSQTKSSYGKQKAFQRLEYYMSGHFSVKGKKIRCT